ncbi:protein polybromo-1 isoform X1 [Diorhabda sublineata]|uniref:protein polybromo-1 isoform X1 n=1 Tax=Diorhabda sublineata TaxID=1163346 RepID=UPI0024E10EC9|nr:protein polybromo-1 isoform X1 [Diorhabda sublineata]
MSKRRRAGSLPKYTEDDSLDSIEASTSSGPTAHKRRKLFDPMEVCHQLVDILRNHKKEDGSLLSESFIRIPKRRQEPSYYEVVSNPIDLQKIHQKLKMDEYEDIDDLQCDIELMVNNAKSFYKKNTQEYKDAVEILDLFIITKNKLLTVDEDSSSKKSATNNKKHQQSPAVQTNSRRSLTKIVTKNNVNHDNDDDENDTDNSNDEEDNPFEELLTAVLNAKDENNKLLHLAFQLLPSKKRYPDYYEVIEQPVDLKMVTNKVNNNKYKFLIEMERDLLLMCKNACLYNEPGSHIYKQAKTLRKFVQAKRIEIDQRRGTMPVLATTVKNNSSPNAKTLGTRTSLNSSRTSVNSNSKSPPNSTKYRRSPSVTRSSSLLNSTRTSSGVNSRWHTPVSVRERLSGNGSVNRNSVSSVNRVGVSPRLNRFHRSGASVSPISDGLRFKHRKVRSGSVRSSSNKEGSDTEDHDLEASIDLKHPHWKLFETVRTATGTNGRPMSDPFWKLPSRRFYPDYYREIKNPMSLNQIRKKLVMKGYGTLSEVAGDLTIMFENAKKYNIPTSKLYKDAVRLQKLMQSKVQELLDVDQVTQRVTNKNRKLFTENTVIRRKPGPKPKNNPLGTYAPTRGRPPKDSTILKKRLHLIAKYMLDYTTEDGRKPMLAFIEKPSKKLYPEYYEVISEPIDFLEIESKIKGEQYSSEADLVKDFKLMFNNCRQFNEENSPIYEDANNLEKYLLNRPIQLKPVNITPEKPKRERIVLKPYKPRRILSPLEKTLKGFFEAIRYYRDPKDNRQLSQAFMRLPSKMEYPDYYEVISNPIDMEKISQKIRSNDYENIEELATDFVLLFDNACKYNEPDSQLYKDALVLQRFLFQTKMQLKEDENTVPDVSAAVQDIFLNLFTNVYNYQDDDGRCYSDSMLDLPEHEEINGKKVRALSLDVIKRRMDKGMYKRLDVFQEDFFACMERARNLSRTDSQVFEDSIELQLYFIRQRDELVKNGELLTSPALLYTEADARASIDDLRAEKALKESIEDETETRSSEDSILKEINVNEEIRSTGDFNNIKEESMVDDTNTSKKINNVNEANGEEEDDDEEEEETMSNENELVNSKSPNDEKQLINNNEANSQSEDVSNNKMKSKDNTQGESVSDVKCTKTEKDSDSDNKKLSVNKELNINNTTNDAEPNDSDGTNGCASNEKCEKRTFQVGEFVYLEAKEKGCDTHILCIERLWENNGQQMIYGNYYFRPAETYHVSTRKFLENEVFKSDSYVAVPVEEIIGKCCVVNVKYYFTMRPEGYEDKDVYVCESRYRTRTRLFKKIKVYPDNPTIKLVPREVPIQPKRVMSVFRERIEKHKDELQELEDLERFDEKEKLNVVADNNMDIDDGNTYYEQFNTMCSGVIKTGDYVYVVADGGKQIIAQIDSIWETKDGKCYFRGPWFIQPTDIPHNPTRLFYKQEVFLSSLEETSPIVSIIGKCHVLELSDWVIYRPTEIPESDVYICASMYDEINKQVKKLTPGGLKKYIHSPIVTEDEIYFFNRVLNPPKEASPQLTKMNDMDITMEDSLDGGPPSVGSGEIPSVIPSTPVSTTPVPTPVPTSKKKSNKNKVVTGYILYSREVRKQVVQNNPESTFGDISRIVGSEWKSLPQHEKQQWEEKASKLNEETKALLLLEQEQCGSPASSQPPPPPVDQVFECLWDNCDYQFEEVSDLIEHCVKDKESQGHVQAFYQENALTEFNCYWRNCSRAKKNVQPFPNMTRLIRHVRDMHINKGNGRSVPPENRSKNFKPSSKPPAVSRPTPSATPNAPPPVLSPNAQKPQEPMFISVPPRPQRVLHSEAYIKYIEGLQAENKHISPWERTLQATQENTPEPDMEKIKNVAVWLGRKADQHDNVVAALWNLRNQLLKDTLSLHKTL